MHLLNVVLCMKANIQFKRIKELITQRLISKSDQHIPTPKTLSTKATNQVIKMQKPII